MANDSHFGTAARNPPPPEKPPTLWGRRSPKPATVERSRRANDRWDRLGAPDAAKASVAVLGEAIGRLRRNVAMERLDPVSGYLETALQAGEATYQHGDRRNNPTLCTGLGGGGELLVELYRETRDERWLNRAREFAEQALVHRSIVDGQHVRPTDTAGCFSADFVYGAAGTGYFFLRVAYPFKFDAPLL